MGETAFVSWWSIPSRFGQFAAATASDPFSFGTIYAHLNQTKCVCMLIKTQEVIFEQLSTFTYLCTFSNNVALFDYSVTYNNSFGNGVGITKSN